MHISTCDPCSPSKPVDRAQLLSPETIGELKIRPVKSEADVAPESAAVNASNLWGEAPALIVVVRRPG